MLGEPVSLTDGWVGRSTFARSNPVGLYKMLQKYAASFFSLGAVLSDFEISFEGAEHVLVATDEETRLNVVPQILREDWIPTLKKSCADLDLQFCSVVVDRLEKASAQEPFDKKKVLALVKDLGQRIRDELDQRVLFYVSPERARHYADFRVGWEEALVRFPVATDVEESEKCYALGRFSGCVYHLMRVAEIGVQELGKMMKIPAATIQEPWGSIVRTVQDRVKRMPHKTSAQKKKQQRYAELADALYQVNLAWRIPAEHPRTPGDQYTEEQASEALGRVKALMRHLAAIL